MSEINAMVSLPSSFPLAVRVSESEMPDFIKRTLAIELYREGKLSLGKAAELADARNKWEMLNILDLRGISLHYDVGDAEDDLNTLDEILG